MASLADRDVDRSHGGSGLINAEEFAALARERGVGFHFEGAVGGAVPMAAGVVEALADDRVLSFSGVLSGTTNYVLTRVARDGIAVDEALDEAKASEYAKVDPSGDLDGSEAARQAAVLSSLAFGVSVRPRDVFTRGIRELSAADLAAANRLGFATRLVVTARQHSSFLRVGVEPHVIPFSHPLSRLDGTRNMLIVNTERAGRLVFSGPDAGGRDTFTFRAVLVDICRALRRMRSSTQAQMSNIESVLGPTDNAGRFMVRCQVVSSEANDVICGCLFGHGIGLDYTSYSESPLGNEVVVLTDLADRSCIERALAMLEQEDIVCMSALRVFEDETYSYQGLWSG